MPAPTKLRRRPAYLALGVLLVALGALVAVWLFTSSASARSVLALRESVARGETITADDLTSVSISVDPLLKVVPAEELSSVVGRRAAVDLAAGGILTQGSFTDQPIPSPGQSLVGVGLSVGQLPGADLQPGDPVRIVQTPKEETTASGKAGASAKTDALTTVAATVVSVSRLDDLGMQGPDGQSVVVTVTVPSSQAPMLSAIVQTGRIALVLDSVAK